MARKIVDIGVEGNDGTGDSIREGFRKVNENFQEIYAVFGQEGTLSLLDLGDVENGSRTTYTDIPNHVAVVNNDGTGLVFKELVGTQGGITISYPNTPGATNYNKIVLQQETSTRTLGSEGRGNGGLFGNHVDGQGFALGGLADPDDTTVAAWNSNFENPSTSLVRSDTFAVTRGFANRTYVNTAGDTMTGYLNVPANASGSAAPRASETVLKSGGTMTGRLFLSDHPGEQAGAGTPIGEDDLQAASKYYVDTTTYSSKVNLYVSTSGDDDQRKTPAGKEGRAWGYAYKSLGAACLKAEALINASQWDMGPYRQLIAYGDGKYYSTVKDATVGAGINRTTRVLFDNDSGNYVDQGIPANRDIIPGKLVVGRNSGARGFIVKYGSTDAGDFVDLRDVTGSFDIGENLYFDSPVKSLEISIFIESGTYYEDYPIRIPRNCSVLGDEFRRTVIRPADRPSQSPWAATWFFRDLTFDGLTIAETNWGYHYLTDPTNKASTPKNNKDIDVFLCNDATIIRQISCQGHGGFMMVLDPEGQILTKSPYCQQSGCFSASLNKQAFRGGQYVDGNTGNLPVTFSAANGIGTSGDPITEITVTDAFRIPQTPTSFFVKGQRYKIDTYTDNGEGYRSAGELLLANRDFIIEETIAYVNEAITPSFVYDQVKCSRDVGYIVNAVSWDLALDSNIQSIFVAQEYFIRSGYSLYGNQKAATLDALGYVKEQMLALPGIANNVSATNRVADKMDTILTILESGIEDLPKTTVSSWTYVTNIENTSSVVTVTKSAGHGFGDGWSVLVEGSTLGGSTPSAAPNGRYNITRLNATQFTFTTSYPLNGTPGGIMQVTASPVPLRSIPHAPTPPLPQDNTTLNYVADLLLANREFFKEEYISWLGQERSGFVGAVDTPYDAVVYRRDLDRIVNAIIYDTAYGGNSMTLLVSNNFFDILGSSYVSAQAEAITAGLAWVKYLASKVVISETITDFRQSGVAQVTSLPLTGSLNLVTRAALSTAVQAKIQLVSDIVENGLSVAPLQINPLIDYAPAGIKDAKSVLDIRKESIRSATIDYINNKYLYDQFKARLDIGYLVDDLAHDIIYTGNLKTAEHGLTYFVGDAALVSPSEIERTKAIIRYVELLALKVVDNLDVPSDAVGDSILQRRQTAVTQQIIIGYGTGPAASSPSLLWVAGLPNNEGTPLVAANQALLNNKVSIQTQIIDWINANIVAGNASQSGIWYNFTYDSGKCARDIGYIIDAIRYDMLFGSNFRSIKAGEAYLRGNASTVTGPQKDATLAAYSRLQTVIGALITDSQYSTLARTRATTGVQRIINIIAAGSITTQLPYSYPDPTGYNVTYLENYGNARSQISANRAFLIKEITYWIAEQKAGNIIPFTSGFTYDVAKCERDIGLIVDAIIYDLTYGGNLETLNAARAYFVGAVSQLGEGQKGPTIAAYERLQTVIDYVARGIVGDGTTWTKTSPPVGESVNVQSTAGSSGSVAAGLFAANRVKDIIDTIDISSVDSKPTLESLIDTVYNIVDGTKPGGYIAAKDLIVANRDFIKSEVVNYLNYQYTFEVASSSSSTNEFTLASGVTNDNMRVNMPVKFTGLDKFEQVVTSIEGPTPIAVPGGNKYLVTFFFARQGNAPLYEKTVNGVTTPIQYEILGNTNSNYNQTLSVAAADQAAVRTTTTSITLVYDTDPNANGGTFGVSTPTTVRIAGGTFGGVSKDESYYVHSLIGNNKFKIKATKAGSTAVELQTDTGEMFCSLRYNQATCFRDVGFIVSNISTDILYGGKYNTIKAGLRYLAGSANLVVGEQSEETRAGITYINTIAQRIINNQAPLVNYQELNAAAGKIEAADIVDQFIDTRYSGGSIAGSDISSLVDIVNYIIENGNLGPNANLAIRYPKYVLQLNEDTPYNIVKSGPIPSTFVLGGAGNTSMLSNDWTQLNDLAYGLVATNNGLIETVSVFTYYCWTAYYSRNGGQIRSVGGSNAHGEYGLVAEGSDPFEVPDDVKLSDDMTQVAKIFKTGPFVGEMAKDKTTIYIDAFNYAPYNASEIEINHGYIVTDNVFVNVGATRYEIANTVDASASYFSVTNPSASVPALVNGKYQVTFTFAQKSFAPEIDRYYTIDGNLVAVDGVSTPTNYNDILTGWKCVDSTSSTITLEFTAENPGTYGTNLGTTILKLRAGTILRLNLNTGGNNATATSGLQKELVHNQVVAIRLNQNFKFWNVDNINPTRPSTALTFRGDPLNDALAPVYRVLSFGTKDPLGGGLVTEFSTLIGAYSSGTTVTVISTSALRVGMSIEVSSGTGGFNAGTTVTEILSTTKFVVSSAPAIVLTNATLRATSTIQNEVILAFDSGYDYVDIVIDQDHNTLTEAEAGIVGGSTTKTLGSKQGDNYLAIKRIGSARDLQRLKTGEMAFAWNGRLHRVVTYISKVISSTESYGIIQIVETRSGTNGTSISDAYQNVSGWSGTGIAVPTRPGTGFNVPSASYADGYVTYNVSGIAEAPPAPLFTASISATTLDVTAVASSALRVGDSIQSITGTGVNAGTVIIRQETATDSIQSTRTGSGVLGSNTLTITAADSNIKNDMFVSGPGVPGNTYVKSINGSAITLTNNLISDQTAQTYTFHTAGKVGTYTVTSTQTVSSRDMGVYFTVYGNNNLSYNISGVVTESTSTYVKVPVSAATVVGSISATGVLTVVGGDVTGNTLQLGQKITGTGYGDNGASVVRQISATEYQLSDTPTKATPSFTGEIAGTTMTVSAVASGFIMKDAVIQRTGFLDLVAGTTVTAQLTATNAAAATAEGAGTSGTAQITLSSITGAVAVGQFISPTGAGIPADTYVQSINGTTITIWDGKTNGSRLLTSNASGNYSFHTAGKEGTYTVSQSQVAASTDKMRAVFVAVPGTFGLGATRIFPNKTLFNPELVEDNTITLKAGLSKNENADIIVNISSTRATSHDFSEIGSGGYNQTNYPNKVYGPGRQKNQKKEVAERGTGRVFWVATDQDGFFRVGRFFTVDQGTGTVTFAASLALSNLDGLGFKRGRAISEFSDDDTFQDLADDAVPTENAIDGYINRRLGIDRNNTVISDGSLGAGFLDRQGILGFVGPAPLQMNGNAITGLAPVNAATDPSFAATKGFVYDTQVMSNKFVNTDGKGDNDIIVYNSDDEKWVNAKSSTANSQVQVDYIGNKEVNIYVKRETITNSQISNSANITQNKLLLNTSSTQRDQGTLIASVTKSVALGVSSAINSNKSPKVNTKFILGSSSITTAPTVGIYYTVTGEPVGSKLNGSWLCVASGEYVNSGTPAFVTLEYPEPPVVSGDLSTVSVIPWETTVTTELAHGVSVGDTVAVTGSAVSAGTNINGNWPVLASLTTTSFVISVNTNGSGTFTTTAARASKVGLSTFNRNQFSLTNGFVELKKSTVTEVVAAIDASSNVITVSAAAMANITVGSIITIKSGGGLVTIPTLALTNPTGVVNGSQPKTLTVTAITSATTFTISDAFIGSGTATSAILNVISGTALSNIQQIETDSIIGNLSGSLATPATVTTGQIVKAGDGIKNAQFNADLLGDVDVRGIMSIVARDTTYPWKNTYGVWNVTKTGAINSIVRTTANGSIEAATDYILKGKTLFTNVGTGSIDMFTPGSVKVLTATGSSAAPAATDIKIGALNTDNTTIQGLVTVPQFNAAGQVTLSPVNANVTINPTNPSDNGTGIVTITSGRVGIISNMDIGTGSATRGAAAFSTLTANDEVTFTKDTDSTSVGTGTLVVTGGVGISKNLNVGGNAIITGNLTVQGVTTTVNSNTVAIADKNVVLASVGGVSGVTPTYSGTLNAATGTITGLVDSSGNAPSGLIPGMTLVKVVVVGELGAFGTGPSIEQVLSQNSIKVTITGGSNTSGVISFTAAGNNDSTGDQGGIILKAAEDKTFIWDKSTDRWTSNVGIEAPTLKTPDLEVTTSISSAGMSVTGNTVLGTAAANTIETKATFVDGNQFKTGMVDTNKLHLSAYDVDGTSFTNLVTLTAGNAPKLELTSTAVGGITNMDIGQTNHQKGKFTELVATDTVTLSPDTKTVTISPTGTGGGVTISPTGTGGLTINPSTTGNIGNVNIGATPYTRGSGAFSTLAANNAVSFTSTTAASRVVNPDTSITVGGALAVSGGIGVAGDVRANKFWGALEGDIAGTADKAKKIQTVDKGDTDISLYLTLVDSHNTTVDDETVYTDGSLSYNTFSNTLTVPNITGTITKATNLKGGNNGTLLGSIPYQSNTDTTAMLAPNTSTTAKFLTMTGTGTNGAAPTWGSLDTAALPSFYIGTTSISPNRESGNQTLNGVSIDKNAATATQFATATTIKLKGDVTSLAYTYDGTGSIEIATSISAAAASTLKVNSTSSTDATYYLLFADGANGAQKDVGADIGSGGAQYNPSNNTLTCNTFNGTATKAQYADLAENYLADAAYEPGTVVSFGGEFEVTQSAQFNDRKVAGVVSTDPAYLMNSKLEGKHVVAIALQGRVPCKVIGRVQKGDILVTSGKPGFAIVNNDPKVGTIIGKSLENKTTDGDGVVEVVVGKH
jgi:hypothetical protein